MTYVRSFFQRFGAHGICVLPAEVISNDPLRVDPDTHIVPPSLRKEAGALGLCFAQVLRSITDGLYWALVAATPALVDAQRVVLTEEHLYHALPWDVRLVDRETAAIRTLMFAHAQAVQPARPLVEEMPAQDIPHLQALTPAPIVPLQPLDEGTFVVSTSELQEAFPSPSRDDDDEFPGAGLLQQLSQKIRKPTRVKPIGACTMQQTLLGAMIDALMNRLYHAQDAVTAFRLKAQCAVLAVLQRWQRLTRQRVVNAIPLWSEEQQRVVWQLTAGIPVEVLA